MKATVIFGLIVFALIGIIVLATLGSIEERKQWAKFSQEHHCKRVGEIQEKVSTGLGVGVTSNGQMGTVTTTNVTPKQIGWLCNDGVTYWRNE